MAQAHIDIDWTAFNRILQGDGAKDARHEAADRVKALWLGHIHPRTGMTQLLIHDDDIPTVAGVGGRTYIETGEAAPLKKFPVNLSAWYWLEYGTSKMQAQRPGRRALAEAAVT